MALLSVVACLAPAQVAAAATPKVVLDPDNDFAFGVRDGITYHGFPIQYDIALAVQSKLPSVCAANVVLTRGAFPSSVPEAVRAAQMRDADVSVTPSLNSNHGVEWGTPSDGGSSAFATDAPGSKAWSTSWSTSGLPARTAGALAETRTSSGQWPRGHPGGIVMRRNGTGIPGGGCTAPLRRPITGTVVQRGGVTEDGRAARRSEHVRSRRNAVPAHGGALRPKER